MSNDKEGLCFDFVVQKNNPKLMTGHANGIITILLRSRFCTERTNAKQFLEPYRTLIGHLRHEGTLFWDRLIYSNKRR
jgi:hypothetical protein